MVKVNKNILHYMRCYFCKFGDLFTVYAVLRDPIFYIYVGGITAGGHHSGHVGFSQTIKIMTHVVPVSDQVGGLNKFN